jgi:hypothetical protein
MQFTSLVYILNFSGIKINRRDFLHRGLFDPRSLTGRAQGPQGRPRWTRSTWSAARPGQDAGRLTGDGRRGTHGHERSQMGRAALCCLG